jgi:uncharacterized phage protein (TIGR01671 family)
MREIKFRAYHKKLKKIYPVHTLMLKEKMVFLVLPKVKRDSELCEVIKRATFSEINLIEFTGLTDKNGAEIYEGDIIKSGVYVYEVIWGKYAGFRLKFIFNVKSNSRKEKAFHSPKLIEIIGNIYENPKLCMCIL